MTEWDDEGEKFEARRKRKLAAGVVPSLPDQAEERLALIFAERHAGDLRYIDSLHRWLIWAGTHWRFDDTLKVLDFARAICREAALVESNKKIAATIASAKTVAAVVSLARSDRSLAATIEQFDSDPWLLNTPDGIIDLRTGERGPTDKSKYITKITGVRWDPNCPTPKWRAWFHRITDGDEALQNFLRRVAGYSLTGSTREHALFFCFGTGANGKSVFINTLAACLGDYHQTAPIETFTVQQGERHPTDLAGLRGARLVTAIETEEGRRWAEARIKAVTGGDAISARFVKQDFFTFKPQFKLIVAGNHKPALRNVDEAMRRRMHLIPFMVKIPLEERDPRYIEGEALRDELPGILAWAVDGCIEWQGRGLCMPKAVRQATDDYLEAEDTLRAWIESELVEDPDAWESSAILFSSWKSWSERTGEFTGDLKRLARSLESHGYTLRRKRIADNTRKPRQLRGVKGLRLNPLARWVRELTKRGGFERSRDLFQSWCETTIQPLSLTDEELKAWIAKCEIPAKAQSSSDQVTDEIIAAALRDRAFAEKEVDLDRELQDRGFERKGDGFVGLKIPSRTFPG